AETVERVRAAARAAGYERNPLTGAVMSLLRRSRGQQFRGVLGALEFVEPARSVVAARRNEAVYAGFLDRSNTLGFKVERIEVGASGVRLSRVDSILHTRGIQGIAVLPATRMPDLTSLSWNRYTAVAIGHSGGSPPVHSVGPAAFRGMADLMLDL